MTMITDKRAPENWWEREIDPSLIEYMLEMPVFTCEQCNKTLILRECWMDDLTQMPMVRLECIDDDKHHGHGYVCVSPGLVERYDWEWMEGEG